tara:strand:+ start:167 stop:739 length:573 start_codon:yes stop_codon:yes gene_type:complete
MLLNRKKTYHSLTDEELIVAYKKKKRSDIIGELYTRYGHLVIGAAMKHLKNRVEAEDITMVIFEKLPRRLINSDIKLFKAWLYTVTRNEVYMFFRKKGIDKVELKEELIVQEELDLDLELEDKLNLIIKEVELLKDPQKICILLFYIERKSYQEISTLLNVEIKKVKSAIQNGKRNLKIKLENCEEFRSI